MKETKNSCDLIREAQRAFMEGYAEDMDYWSALRQEQEEWCGGENALKGDAAKRGFPKT